MSSSASSPGYTSLIRVNSPWGVLWSAVTLIRTCVVETVAAKGTARRTDVLPVTVAAVRQAAPSQVSTVKSAGTPSELDSSVMPGRDSGAAVVTVRVSG